VEYSDSGSNLAECVNSVAWWTREAARAGDQLFLVHTDTAAQLDASANRGEMAAFVIARQALLPGLPQHEWASLVTGTPSMAGGRKHLDNAGVIEGDIRAVMVQGLACTGTVAEVSERVAAVRLNTCWSLGVGGHRLDPHIVLAGVDTLGPAQSVFPPGVGMGIHGAGATSPMGFTSPMGATTPIGAVLPRERGVTSPMGGQMPHAALSDVNTTATAGSALHQALEITPEERARINEWPSTVGKSRFRMESTWTREQFEGDEDVMDKVRRMREFLHDRAADARRSTGGLVYGTWKLLSVNLRAARCIRRWFRVNEQNVAVGQAQEMDRETWIDSVFQELTGVNYMRLGRVQQMEAFGLPESWKLGTARRCVQGWIECVQDEPLKRTWSEAEMQVVGLLRATGFQTVIEDLVMPQAEEAYRAQGTGDSAVEFWSQVRDVFGEVLEGVGAGLFYEWVRFKAAPKQYVGRFDFGAVLVHGSRLLPMRWAGGRHNQIQSDAPDHRRAQPPMEQGQLYNMSAHGHKSRYHYLPYEEAIKHQLEPCGFHADLLMRQANNTHTREELLANMHCYGACLRIDNPYLRATLLGPDGVEAITQREALPREDPKRKEIWKDQQREVWQKAKDAMGARVTAVQLDEQLHETDEGVMSGHIDGERVTLLMTSRV